MYTRKNNLPQKKEASHLTALLIFFILATVVLCLILLFGQSNNTKSFTSGQDPLLKNFINKEELREDDNKETPTNKNLSSPQIQKTPNPKEQEVSKENAQTPLKSQSGSSQLKTAIVCTEEASVFCVLKKSNPFASFLENNPFVTGIIIDGKKVMIEKINHQLVFRILENNKVTDSSGKTIASSSLSYNEATKELVVLIGVDKKYYQSLTISEQKTFYTSQLVRAIFSVTEEAPSNYPKVAKIVGKLSYWDPNSE